MLSFVKRVDRFAHKNWILAPLLLVLFLLRLPNFFEPYWYGDEAIYLTIGTAMRHGERLYLDIIDHKTPIIYYLAMVPSQFLFRVELLVAMCIATVLFYHFAERLLQKKGPALLATVLFVLFTTLPVFEGNIPNGELFVIFFVMIGAWIVSGTHYFQDFLHEHYHVRKHETLALFASGVFFSLGILTKVPALLDGAAFLSIAWFSTIIEWRNLRVMFQKALVLGAGIIVPILLSIVYYTLRGSVKAYLDYGLLYNFRYVGEWQLPFQSKVLLFLFTLKGKVLLLAIWGGLLTLFAKKFSRPFLFIATWLSFAVFAALLSNRPYPHYALQVFPPLSLLIAFVYLRLKEHVRSYVPELAMTAVGLVLIIGVYRLLNVGSYPAASYYSRFWQLITHQITAEQYRNSFDSLMSDNYRAASEIGTGPLFIWGTDPVLYAQTHTAPPGRFTVSFHVHDFHAEAETYQAVAKATPQYIVVLKDESALPHLNNFLEAHYIPNYSYQHFTLWKHLK